jgi:hypothetical protein
VVDPVDVDDALVLVDPVDEAIVPDSRAVAAFELPSEPMPDSVRVEAGSSLDRRVLVCCLGD